VIARFALLVMATLAMLGFAGEAVLAKNESPETRLAAVRVVASDPEVLGRVASAAARAGWTEARMDTPESITLLVPQNYTPEKFSALLEALETVKPARIGLQLIDNLGRKIGPDGKPLEE
jgi:hypothetical protein